MTMHVRGKAAVRWRLESITRAGVGGTHTIPRQQRNASMAVEAPGESNSLTRIMPAHLHESCDGVLL